MRYISSRMFARVGRELVARMTQVVEVDAFQAAVLSAGIQARR